MRKTIGGRVKLVQDSKEGFYGHIFVKLKNGELHHVDYKTEYDFKEGEEIKLEFANGFLGDVDAIIYPFKESVND